MSYGINAYNQSTARSIPPRQVETMAFGQVIMLLKAAKDHKSRLHALNMNQKLWSAVLREISIENNDLPVSFRENLFRLADWSSRYSIRAMLKNISLKPLVEVNQNILDGLRTSPTSCATQEQAGNKVSAA
ncbi:MAG: hypothetical protein GX413_01380 [Acetobacter sp.]|jgi:flagellar protein FlaF|nr:hypothetical protein [Acetobacter sp.]